MRMSAAAAATALLLTACATTTSGTGAALRAPSGSTASATGFPSAPGSATASPTAGRSAPGSSSAPGGVLVTYSAGHFRARFPSQPRERSQPGTVGSATYVVYAATVDGASTTIVASEDFTPKLPSSQYQVALRAALGSFGGSSGLTVEAQRETTFQGHVGRQGTFTSDSGDRYTLVAFMYSGNRLYLLFAAEGSAFQTLAASFVALP
jgi:hypothetical protein